MNAQRGSLSLELALLVPALVLLIIFVAHAAAITSTRADLDDAAWEGARAASLARSPFDADAAARQAIDRRLAHERWSCGGQNVQVNTTRFEPGGVVAVDISCSVRLAERGLLLPGSARLHSSAAEPLEPYRALR